MQPLSERESIILRASARVMKQRLAAAFAQVEERNEVVVENTVATPQVNIDNVVEVPQVSLAAPEVVVENLIESPIINVENVVETPQVLVTVDMTPVALALDRLTEQMAQLLQALAEREAPMVTVMPANLVLPDRKPVAFRLETSTDGTKRIIPE